MKRTALLLALIAAAGAVVNVLVAWACAIYSPLETEYVFDFTADLVAADWPIEQPDRHRTAGAPAAEWFVDRDSVHGFGVTRVELIPVIDTPPHGPEYGTVMISVVAVAYETSAGWPLRSLRGQQLDAFLSPDPARRGWWPRWGVPQERLRLPGARDDSRGLVPLRPMWPGFAADSLLYAGALWLVLLGPRAAGRAARRAGGRCAACGYDLTALASDRCPECGAGRAFTGCSA